VTNPRFLVAGGVLALAVGYLVLTGMQSTAVYYLTVSELTAQPSLVGRQVRLGRAARWRPGAALRGPGRQR
jgi:cytochrome c-type biogenesis protein CcmE